MNYRKLLTAKEVSSIYRLSPNVVRKMIKNNIIEGVVLPNGSYRVYEDAVSSVMNKK